MRIKRYTNNGRKIHNQCSIPVHLGFSTRHLPGGNGEIQYNLISFIVHYGLTEESGHYLCYSCEKGKWYLINDGIKEEISQRQIKNILACHKGHKTPYVFYYERNKNFSCYIER